MFNVYYTALLFKSIHNRTIFNKHVQCTRNENLIVVTNKTTLYSTIQTVYNEPYIPVS